jgi:hypothetical protein
MERFIVKVKELFSPEEEIVVTKVGDKYIIEKLNSEKILKVIANTFKDLSDEEKIRIGLEAKKWSRG